MKATLMCWLLHIGLASTWLHRPAISNGGWETFPADVSVRPGPCNIAIRDNRLTEKEFLEKYAYAEPVIVRDTTNNDLFRALTGR